MLRPQRTVLGLLTIGLLALALSPALPVAQAAGNCPGSVTATSVSPVGEQSERSFNVRVTFHAQGPGYIPGVCDIGWITACALFLDGQAVSASCSLHNGGSFCGEEWIPYDCDFDLTSSVTITPGPHTLQATGGMTWGCCGWQGGPQATASTAWGVSYRDVNEIGTPSSVGVVVYQPTPLVTIGPTTLTVPIPVVVSVQYYTEKNGGVGTGPYGPTTAVVPTPFGSIPVTLCPQTCPYPTSDLTVFVYVAPKVNGQAVATLDKEIAVVIPSP